MWMEFKSTSNAAHAITFWPRTRHVHILSRLLMSPRQQQVVGFRKRPPTSGKHQGLVWFGLRHKICSDRVRKCFVTLGVGQDRSSRLRHDSRVCDPPLKRHLRSNPCIKPAPKRHTWARPAGDGAVEAESERMKTYV